VTANNAANIRKGVAILGFNYINCFAHTIHLVFEKASERVGRLELLREKISKVIADYMTGSFLINCYKSGLPKRLHAMIKDHEYTINWTGKTRFFDSSKTRIGHQAVYNRLDDIVLKFDNGWRNLQTKDSVRIYLKRILFN